MKQLNEYGVIRKYMAEKELDLLDFIAKEDISIEKLIKLLFVRYKERKKANTLYSRDDFIPQNLIKLYYATDGHLDFSQIVENFKKNYIWNENEIEDVHNKLERQGLAVVYDYIQSNKTEKIKNIYLLIYLHQLLYSKVPYKEHGGKFRNAPTFISHSDVPTSDPESISREIADLYPAYDKLIQFGDEINKTKDVDKIIEYIDKCVELKVKLIKIHPFPDGNGRTCRALLNVLFKRINLPPTYVKKKEKDEYIKAMDMAIRMGELSLIKRFYYYTICDSIIELDIDERLNKEKIDKKHL